MDFLKKLNIEDQLAVSVALRLLLNNDDYVDYLLANCTVIDLSKSPSDAEGICYINFNENVITPKVIFSYILIKKISGDLFFFNRDDAVMKIDRIDFLKELNKSHNNTYNNPMKMKEIFARGGKKQFDYEKNIVEQELSRRTGKQYTSSEVREKQKNIYNIEKENKTKKQSIKKEITQKSEVNKKGQSLDGTFIMLGITIMVIFFAAMTFLDS